MKFKKGDLVRVSNIEGVKLKEKLIFKISGKGDFTAKPSYFVEKLKNFNYNYNDKVYSSYYEDELELSGKWDLDDKKFCKKFSKGKLPDWNSWLKLSDPSSSFQIGKYVCLSQVNSLGKIKRNHSPKIWNIEWIEKPIFLKSKISNHHEKELKLLEKI